MEDDSDDDHSIKPTAKTADNSLSVNSIFKDTATAVEFDLNGPTTPALEGERTATPTTLSQTKRTDNHRTWRSY
jgi:hypothetical protein